MDASYALLDRRIHSSRRSFLLRACKSSQVQLLRPGVNLLCVVWLCSTAVFAATTSKWEDEHISSKSVDDDLETGRATGYWSCDRECRWHFGFFDRRIHGRLEGFFNKKCECEVEVAGELQGLGEVAYPFTSSPFVGPPPLSETFRNARPFDPDYWANDYSTPYLCAIDMGMPGATPRSYASNCTVHSCSAGKAALEARGLTVLHCGKCGACSMPSDIQVLWDTRESITQQMTACATKFRVSNTLGFRPQTLGEMKQCLREVGIQFSDDGRAWSEPANRPTCFDCWTDNIMNDAQLCWNFCLSKFVHSKNAGHFGKDPCLQCDEYTSGPAFIKCAGANRRSTGIASDIDRNDLASTKWEQHICTAGICAAREGEPSRCDTLLRDPLRNTK
uniref:Uncharacterized protein n=2 Tax=Chrysotila carterae TaxID=13221 RepID=A0A7S4EX56_CHRCT